MYLGSLSVLLLLFYLVQAHSSGEEKKPDQHHCPPSFECTKLGNLAFPFTSQTCPRPDWLTLSGCDGDDPSIQLQKEGRWYKVKSISQSDIIRIDDPSLREKLSSKSCKYFEDMVFPNTTFLSFQLMNPSLPILKCNRHDSHHRFGSNLPHVCSDYVYSVHSSHDEHNETMILSPHCSVINLPGAFKGNTSELFSLLSAEFSLRVHINEDCVSCHHLGGECVQDIKGHFRCLKGRDKSDLKLGLALGLGIGLLFIVAIYLLWCIRGRREKHKSASSEHTRNDSSHHSSRADLEEGSINNGVYIFSYSELEEATNHFKESNEIVDGRFGAAYYGKLQDGREVAVKRLYIYNNKRLDQFILEIKNLTRLRHPNLISLYGYTQGLTKDLLLVQEFIPNGTLSHHLQQSKTKTNPSMTWPIRMSIAIQTSTALSYLHSSQTIHGDVKSDNILLHKNFLVKVSGFELSSLFPTDVTHASTSPLGTPGYVDPEYLKTFQLSEKSDVYSFGVVLMELISSMAAFDRHRNELSLASLVKRRVREGTFDEFVDPSLGFGEYEGTRKMILSVAELGLRCLREDKDMRPDMAEVKECLEIIRSGKGKSVTSVWADEQCGRMSNEVNELYAHV